MRLLALIIFVTALGVACTVLFLRSVSTPPLLTSAPTTSNAPLAATSSTPSSFAASPSSLATPSGFTSPAQALATAETQASTSAATVSSPGSSVLVASGKPLALTVSFKSARAVSAPTSPAASAGRTAGGFAALRPVPADTIPIPAVLALDTSRLDLTPEQRAVVELLAADFADAVGEPDSDKPAVDSPFAQRVRAATSEADFIFRQRYGHHTWVQLQMQTTHQLNGY